MRLACAALLLLLAFCAVAFGHKGSIRQDIGDYWYEPTVLVWEDAVTFCGDRDMKLVSVDSASKELEIKLLLIDASLGATKMWTSGHNKTNTFVWTGLNDAPFTYTNWYAGEPNDISPEICVLLEAEYGWHDFSCFYKYPFLCEPAA